MRLFFLGQLVVGYLKLIEHRCIFQGWVGKHNSGAEHHKVPCQGSGVHAVGGCQTQLELFLPHVWPQWSVWTHAGQWWASICRCTSSGIQCKSDVEFISPGLPQETGDSFVQPLQRTHHKLDKNPRGAHWTVSIKHPDIMFQTQTQRQ